MKIIAPWILFTTLSFFLSYYFLFVTQVQLGGDIVEYFGITESVKNHRSFELTLEDQVNLEEYVHPAYFNDPGYYIHGTNENRYPVHFVFYSLLALPFRLFLEALQLDPRKSLYLVNILAYLAMVVFVWKKYIPQQSHRIIFLLLSILSPLLSFFIWPGPDLFVISLLTMGVFAFMKKELALAALLTAIASWHSQPIIFITLLFLLYYFVDSFVKQKRKTVPFKPLIIATLIGLLALIPYGYNYLAFGVLTPWTLLADGWTTLRGFGLHNASLKKLYEQLFDLNIGFFWYAPVLTLLAITQSTVLLKQKNTKVLFLLSTFFITLFFFQTNPGWHYGTSGYGPGRHALFLLALFFYLGFEFLSSLPRKTAQMILLLCCFVQISVLSMNGFLEPQLPNTLVHSPFAKIVLTHAPQIYNPTPEIFVDRTNHTDITKLQTAIYAVNGTCKKAYVLNTDMQLFQQACANFDTVEAISAFQDPFKRAASYPRTVTLDEATLWPDSHSCEPTYEGPFFCPKSHAEILEVTEIMDPERVATLPELPHPGIWKILPGDPITITVPPGYIIDYTATEGIYVDF